MDFKAPLLSPTKACQTGYDYEIIANDKKQ